MLPQYMAIGMPQEEFWHGEPRLCAAYREAWRIKQDNAYLAEWRAGVYTERAFAVVMDHALSKNSTAEFPEEPLWMSPETKRERDRAKQRENMLRAREMFKARAEAFNSARRKQQKPADVGRGEDNG